MRFNDGLLDMYRFRFKSYLKNPGARMQTDKRQDMTMIVEASPGKGVFLQCDGHTRFAFSPTGDQFHVFIRKVLNLPVLIGPRPVEKITLEKKEAAFEMCGDQPADKEQVRVRLLKSVRGQLEAEMNATEADISAAKIPLYQAPHETRGQTAMPKGDVPQHEG